MARKSAGRDRVAFALLDDTAAPKEPWYRSVLTDWAGNWDAGAIISCLVVLYMCVASWHDTVIMKRAFDAMAFGTGIGAVLGGFGFYKVGDRRPHGSVVTTTTTAGDPPIR